MSENLLDQLGILQPSDALRRRRNGNGGTQSEVEEAPIPEPIKWPSLDADAYYGIAGEIVRAIEPESESDPVAILIQLLVMFGNLIGRGPYYTVEGTSHHVNLFAVLVGSTSRGRKGTSEGRVRSILHEVDEEWLSENIKQGCVSGEGIIWNVRDEIWGVSKKGEEVLLDEGITDKRLLVVESEFAAVLRVCKRETNTLSPTLRSAWDSGSLRTLAKTCPAKATDAYISLIGHITQDELRRSLAACDSINGFANRFLWVAVRRSKLLPDGGQDLDLSRYADRLDAIVQAARQVERMRRDQAAAVLWRKTYVELATDNSTGLLAAVTSRAEAQVLRLSMIYSLLDGTGTITQEHLQAALALWRYCQASARLIFGDASGDSLLDRVLNAIRQRPGISRWELHSTICKHKSAGVLVEVLTQLRDSGKIRSEISTTGGRSAETWFPAGEREKREIREIRHPAEQQNPPAEPHTSLSSLISQGQSENEMETFTL